MHRNLTFSSLYSGCGGLDLGFEAAGFRPISAFDNDSAALKTLSNNLSSTPHLIDLSDFRDEHISLISGSDVLIAGPPCQGFSTAGKNDPNDSRNNHVSNVARIAALTKPKLVIIENVRGLLSKRNSSHLEKTTSILSAAGYKVTSKIHTMSDYGIAQKRTRVLITAVLADAPLNIELKCEQRKCLSTSLDNVGQCNDFKTKTICKTSPDYKIALKIKPGQKLSNVRSGISSIHTWDIPQVFGAVTKTEVSFLETVSKLRRQQRRRTFGDADPVHETTLQPLFGSKTHEIIETLLRKGYLRRIDDYIDIANTFNGKFRRLDWNELAPTVDTRFGQHRYFLHPSENRGFSFREAARIQSFPDTFKFQGSDSSIYRMIGNAVPPKFAEKIATEISHRWEAIC